MSTRIHLVPLALSVLLGLGACATQQSMGEQVDDATLQMRVGRALIADPQTSAMEIDVDVVDGVVYLKGDVDSEQEKMQAARVAANTVGVKEVRNDLQIEGMMPEGEDTRSDIAIRTSVGTRLMADPDTSRMNIDVDVVNGVVYLTGIVETVMVNTSTPIDDETTDTVFAYSVNTGGDPQKALGVGAAIIRDLEKQMNEDIPIWEHKKYFSRPMLCDGDGQFGVYRRWMRQFFSEEW